MENERCTGHEDIDWWDHTVDTKVCETFDTFPVLKESTDKAYWWQWQAYMWLKWEEYKKHTVAKVLVNSPMRQIREKLYYCHNNLDRKYDGKSEYIEEEYEAESHELFLNMVFDQQVEVNSNWVILKLQDDEVIPYGKRVHLVTFERDDEAIAQISERVKLCRDYLTQLWY
jgi:hypothetical protein